MCVGRFGSHNRLLYRNNVQVSVDVVNSVWAGATLVARLLSIGLRVLNVPIHDRFPGLERPVATAVGVMGELKR